MLGFWPLLPADLARLSLPCHSGLRGSSGLLFHLLTGRSEATLLWDPGERVRATWQSPTSPCDSCVLWGDVPSLSACQRGQGSSDAPGDPFQSSGQRGLLTVAAPRAPPGSRTPQLLHPSANRPWPWPGHTLPGKSTQLCSLCSLEPLPLQGTRGDSETQAPLHSQVAPFTYFSWLSRGLSPLPRLPVLLGEGVQRWGAAGSRVGARPSRQSLSLKLSTQLSPNASGQGGV